MKKQRVPIDLLSLAGAVSALAVAIALNARHRLPDRFLTLMVFLLCWTFAAGYVALARYTERRRSKYPRRSEAVLGVRLSLSYWLLLGDSLQMVAGGSVLAAASAVAGYPGIGIGLFMPVAALAAAVYVTSTRIGIVAVTFETAGLRLQARGAAAFFSWSNIEGVERDQKSTLRTIVYLRVRDPGALVETIEPNNPKAEQRFRTFALGPDGKVLLPPWIGGLDGLSLEHKISAAKLRGSAKPN